MNLANLFYDAVNTVSSNGAAFLVGSVIGALAAIPMAKILNKDDWYGESAPRPPIP